MAPSAKVISAALVDTVEKIFRSDDRDALTVRLVRTKVEEGLDLGEGFLVQSTWKERSKKIIKDSTAKLLAEEEPGDVSSPPVKTDPEPVKVEAEPVKKATPATKKGTKRSSTEEKSRPKKRQKKEETPSNNLSSELSEEGDPVSDFSDSEDSEAPKSKKAAKSKAKPQPKRQSKVKKAKVESESEDEEDKIDGSFGGKEEESDAKPTPEKVKRESITKGRAERPKVESDEEEKDSDIPKKMKSESKSKSSSPQNLRKSKVESPAAMKRERTKTKHKDGNDNKPVKEDPNLPSKLKPEAVKSESEEEKAEIKANDSDSEMSVVLDEGPQRAKASKKAKSNPSSSKPKAAPKDLSPTEQQIKTLQSQLVKCGVRKIWAFELKQYEDDSAKKIRHLQGMLKDVGMVGRFSEARAREIKEMRELAADLEAVQEGNEVWGLGRGRRNAGKERKIVKDESDDDEGDEHEDEDEGGKRKGSASFSEKPSRAAKVKQELAFLGDEESSDD